MNKKHVYILCISSVAFYLSGCASPAEPEGMIYHAQVSEKAISSSPYYKNIEVTTQ